MNIESDKLKPMIKDQREFWANYMMRSYKDRVTKVRISIESIICRMNQRYIGYKGQNEFLFHLK